MIGLFFIIILIVIILSTSISEGPCFKVDGKKIDRKHFSGLSIYKVTDRRFLDRYSIEKGSMLLVDEDTWKYGICSNDMILLLSGDAIYYDEFIKDTDIIGKVCYIISPKEVGKIRLGMLGEIKRMIN